jgi:hypothetical protein
MISIHKTRNLYAYILVMEQPRGLASPGAASSMECLPISSAQNAATSAGFTVRCRLLGSEFVHLLSPSQMGGNSIDPHANPTLYCGTSDGHGRPSMIHRGAAQASAVKWAEESTASEAVIHMILADPIFPMVERASVLTYSARPCKLSSHSPPVGSLLVT